LISDPEDCERRDRARIILRVAIVPQEEASQFTDSVEKEIKAAGQN
jgi:hypothetical protein